MPNRITEAKRLEKLPLVDGILRKWVNSDDALMCIVGERCGSIDDLVQETICRMLGLSVTTSYFAGLWKTICIRHAKFCLTRLRKSHQDHPITQKELQEAKTGMVVEAQPGRVLFTFCLNDLIKAFDHVMKSLTYREREIMRLRWGLGGGYGYTLEEVGRIFKVTRNRIMQIESKALKKLKHHTRSDYLKKYVLEDDLDEDGKDEEFAKTHERAHGGFYAYSHRTRRRPW